jgi:hypothetical protein
MKAFLKFVLVAIFANALWQVSTGLSPYYKFKDAVLEAASVTGRSENDLRQKIVELASMYGMAVTAEMITFQPGEHHTIVEASFTQPISVFPGVQVPWPLNMYVDAPVLTPVKMNDSAK